MDEVIVVETGQIGWAELLRRAKRAGINFEKFSIKSEDKKNGKQAKKKQIEVKEEKTGEEFAKQIMTEEEQETGPFHV
ncbi:hypothetical protein BLNAU_17569 [Blattamonas nauphoetae]|uniref:Uncharacterized protein n=1 Tax=Blattamonas nauphoetae TaxID=2049346 RepID=A0ABQ9X414_9EUKA|nr:hypothetical protein BLNAU_20000 [Blattamonas nauphoetae]KAK2947483.1 hypothetical protein BLNAU_17569 [Blattamonas nauphoetae]